MSIALKLPNWLIIVAAAGQIFTAIIYPYVRHAVLNWYNDIKKLTPLNREIAKNVWKIHTGAKFFLWPFMPSFYK
jgi:hypothetical protein